MNATTNAGASKDELGLFQKFVCYRVDGRDQPGREREEARYFVSDYRYDPHAWLAVCSYMTTCSRGYPKLAVDLANDLLQVYPKLAADPKAAAVLRDILTTLGVPADVPFEDSPMYRLVAKYAGLSVTNPGGTDGDQEARPQAAQAGGPPGEGEGHQAGAQA